MCAARRAASGDMPRAMLSSVSISRYERNSSARSRSHCALRKNRRQLMPLLRRRIEDPADRADDLFPTRRLCGELLTAGGGQPVVLRLAVVVGCAPERGDPAA